MTNFTTGMALGMGVGLSSRGNYQQVSRDDLVKINICKSQKNSEMQIQCFTELQNQFKHEYTVDLTIPIILIFIVLTAFFMWKIK